MMRFILLVAILLFFLNITSSAFTIISTPEMDPSTKTVLRDRIPVYDTTSSVNEIAAINEGEEVEIIGRNRDGRVYKIKKMDGTIGYMAYYYLDKTYQEEIDRKVSLAIANESKELKRINLSSSKCPIKLLDVYITYNSIDIPQVNIEYINKSDKTVIAFSMRVYCYNVYNEPTGMFGNNVFGGIASDENLKPNDIGTGTWTLNTHELTKKVKIKIYKIQFSDGTKWIG